MKSSIRIALVLGILILLVDFAIRARNGDVHTEGAEQRSPMGQAVIGGVITSSLLTVVVVPVVYCCLDDLAQWAARLWRRAPSGTAQAAS